MPNPLYTLIALLLVLSYPTGSEPLLWARPEYRWALYWGIRIPLAPLWIFLMTLLYAAVISLLYRKTFEHFFIRFLGRLTALLVFAIEVFILHGPLWINEDLGLGENLFLSGMMMLIPYFTLLTVNAGLATRADVTRHPTLSPRSSIPFALRTYAGFILLPISLLLLLQHVLSSQETLRRWTLLYPPAEWALLLLVLLGFLAAAPAFLRLIFKARPIPEGLLRQRLECLCRRANFMASDLLIVKTGPTRTANAFVTGLIGPLRYVFLTDALLDRLKSDEIECVLAHEVAHAKQGHIQAYVLFSLTYVIAAAFLLEHFSRALEPGLILTAVMIGFAALFWIFIFGYASRRFESEADLFGMRLTGGSTRFAAALEKVASTNRMSRNAPSWRHFSIARRIALLRSAEHEPRVERTFRQAAQRLRRWLGAFAILAVLYLGTSLLRERADVPRRKTLLDADQKARQGERALNDGHPDDALQFFEAALEGFHRSGTTPDGTLYYLMAVAEEKRGRSTQARKLLSLARMHRVTHPIVRLALE